MTSTTVYSASYVLQVLHTVPENDPVQVEGILNDAGGGDPGPENILLSWQIFNITDSFQIVKETRSRTNQLNQRLNLFVDGADYIDRSRYQQYYLLNWRI